MEISLFNTINHIDCIIPTHLILPYFTSLLIRKNCSKPSFDFEVALRYYI